MNTTVTRPRRIEQLIAGRATSDGAGVKLTRVLTHDLQRRLDPFLMLDAFGSDDPTDYIAGFPDHPHRGFETVTYMIAGRMRHRDSAGHEGLLENGGVQWMTAGRGVIHSEIPEQEDGVMEGFQLWLNLPAQDKMQAPWYRDFRHEDLPRFTTEQGVAVTVIAGVSHGIAGAVRRDATAPLYLDLHLPAGARFEQVLPAGHNAFVYVYRGSVGIAGQAVRELITVNGIRVVLQDGTWGLVRASSNKPELVIVVESPTSEENMRAIFADIDHLLSQQPEVGAFNQKI